MLPGHENDSLELLIIVLKDAPRVVPEHQLQDIINLRQDIQAFLNRLERLDEAWMDYQQQYVPQYTQSNQYPANVPNTNQYQMKAPNRTIIDNRKQQQQEWLADTNIMTSPPQTANVPIKPVPPKKKD